MTLPHHSEISSYWPTDEERAFFQKEGYLVVPDALAPESVVRLNQAVDRCGHGEGDKFYNRVDILGLDDAFLELIDTPKVFAKICGFLGWNIWVNHTHYNIRPPDNPKKRYNYMWHRDGGNFTLDLQNEAPMTAIKVGFFLTDLSEKDRGCTYLIPEHLEDAKTSVRRDRTAPPPQGALPLLLKPGSAVIFQQRVFHSQGSPNYSLDTRKAIFIQWAFRWLFPVDMMSLGDLNERIQDPIRRQLLGLSEPREPGDFSPRYYPLDSEVPLKKFMLQKIGMARVGEIGPATSRYLARFLKFDF